MSERRDHGLLERRPVDVLTGLSQQRARGDDPVDRLVGLVALPECPEVRAGGRGECLQRIAHAGRLRENGVVAGPRGGNHVERLARQRRRSGRVSHVHNRRRAGHGDRFLDSPDAQGHVDSGGQSCGEADFLAPHRPKPRQREDHGISANWKRADPVLPCSSVTVSRAPCSDGLETVTVTPGMTPWLSSVTVPLRPASVC